MKTFPILTTLIALICMLLLRTNMCMAQSSNLQLQLYQFPQFEESDQFLLIEGDEQFLVTTFNPVVFIKVKINKKNLLLKYGKKDNSGMSSAEFEMKYSVTKKSNQEPPQVLKSQTVKWNGFWMPGQSSEFAYYAIFLSEKEIGNRVSDIIVKIEIRRKGQTPLLESVSQKLFVIQEGD
jgi:hypothetical protein